MRRITVSAIVMAVATGSMASRPSSSRADPVHEVQVAAKKFAFEPSIIQVVAGEPVRLVIRSSDAVHGFAIRDLNIDVQTPRGGGTVVVEFTAPRPGRYEVACSEFCGSGHGQMRAALVSVTATGAGTDENRRRGFSQAGPAVDGR
jgi:heme/copper-type cytochrome/quinol oxidase subunit 2